MFQKDTIAVTSSSFVCGLPSHWTYPFSSCHIFFIGLLSGDFCGVSHQLTSSSCKQACVGCMYRRVVRMDWPLCHTSSGRIVKRMSGQGSGMEGQEPHPSLNCPRITQRSYPRHSPPSSRALNGSEYETASRFQVLRRLVIHSWTPCSKLCL